MIDCGKPDKLVKTVIPVVVKPLTDSKKQSINFFFNAILKGRAPIREDISQAKETTNILETRSSLKDLFLNIILIPNPNIKQMREGIKKDKKTVLPSFKIKEKR